MVKTERFRSWFCVLNNPQKIFGDIEPEKMVDKALDLWCENKPTRSAAANFEVSDTDTPHMHIVLEDTNKCSLKAIQKAFTVDDIPSGIHVAVTRGNKEQAVNYLYKRGEFEEKQHTLVVEPRFRGEISSNQGKRIDLEYIQELIDKGLRPNEIFDTNIMFRSQRYAQIIRSAYFSKRCQETPPEREVEVFWHVGQSGTGKSYEYVKLCEEYGEDSIYLVSDFSNAGFDLYMGEPIIIMDEFKGQMPYGLLLQVTQGYKQQIHCRYNNSYMLWSTVHITSVFPPEDIYKIMVPAAYRDVDGLEQLMRRITKIIYHYKENGEYKAYEIDAKDYVNYKDLTDLAHGRKVKGKDGFEVASQEEIPFED